MSHFQDSFWVRPFVAAVLASPLPWGPGVGWCDQAAASQRLASSGHAASLPPSLPISLSLLHPALALLSLHRGPMATRRCTDS